MERKDLIAHTLRKLTARNKADQYLIYIDKEICHIDKPKSYKTEAEAVKDIKKYFDSMPYGFESNVDELIKEGVIQIKPVVNEFKREEDEIL